MLRADLRRLNRWTPGDRQWLRSWGQDPLIRSGKFNAGQKLNSAFVAGAGLVLLGTGLILKWFGPFPLSWRTGATFVHDLVATALVIAVIGHVAYALSIRNREPLGSMFKGWISEGWAREHAPGWLEEMTGPQSGAGQVAGETRPVLEEPGASRDAR